MRDAAFEDAQPGGFAMRLTEHLACIALALAIAGCAGLPAGPSPSDSSSFLDRNLDFQPAADGSGAMVYRKRGITQAEVRRYTRFIVDPVMIWYAPQSDFKGIYPDEFKAITDYFRAAAIGELQGRYAVVNDAGPGTLRIRAAIVDMHRENPLRLYQFTPVGLALTGVKEAAGANEITRERVLAGSSYIIAATIEVAFFDSTTGELLGAYRDSARVSPQRQTEGGATWGQVKSQLDLWAKKFRARVDAAQDAK
jgi:Protein of unknown function (DUF3313)